MKILSREFGKPDTRKKAMNWWESLQSEERNAIRSEYIGASGPRTGQHDEYLWDSEIEYLYLQSLTKTSK
jgi:hypothetical protein